MHYEAKVLRSCRLDLPLSMPSGVELRDLTVRRLEASFLWFEDSPCLEASAREAPEASCLEWLEASARDASDSVGQRDFHCKNKAGGFAPLVVSVPGALVVEPKPHLRGT